jgi:signal transduction histidine kinase
MLRQGALDAEATPRALDSIERNARAQVKLLEDLLDISRAITGKLRMDARPIDVGRSLEAAVESVRPAADAKSITIELNGERRVNWVTGDPDRLQQILWNLLSNAVKFTPEHGRVTAKIQRVNSQVEITVSDSGVGISADFVPFVFERFAQGNMTGTRVHGGLGLGLAIVRHLVELHGGTVSAASAGEGQGATFTVMLPLRAVRQNANDVVRIEPPASVDAGMIRPVLQQGLTHADRG